MFHEKSAHQVALVSESLGMHIPRIQQEPRGFEATRSEHIGASSDRAPPAAQISDLERLDGGALRIGLNVEHRRTEQHPNFRRIFQIAATSQREALELFVELEEVGTQLVGFEAGRSKSQCFPELFITVCYLKVERPQCIGVVGGEGLLTKGPTGVLDPGPPFEVDWIELNDAPAPDRGRSAKDSQPALIEWVVGKPDRLSDAEILELLLVVRRPALDDTNLEPFGRELSRQCYPRSSGAYDADLGVVDGAIRAVREFLNQGRLQKGKGGVGERLRRERPRRRQIRDCAPTSIISGLARQSTIGRPRCSLCCGQIDEWRIPSAYSHPRRVRDALRGGHLRQVDPLYDLRKRF